jgi:hypothetical protein
MPQAQFPFFPAGVIQVTSMLACSCEKGKVTYFNYGMPVFIHDESDRDSFRMITAQFCVSGHAKQAEIVRAFGVPGISVKRAVKLFREEGAKGFYKEPKRRGPAVLTPDGLEKAQNLLDEGLETPEVAQRLGIKSNTLYKAVRVGKLHIPIKKKDPTPVESTKSARCEEDHAATMGVGTTNSAARVAASKGELQSVAPQFETALDVPSGGVLLALPALLAIGLLETTERFFVEPKGYYGLDSLFLLLAMMALTRQQSIESMRFCAPGEGRATCWVWTASLKSVPCAANFICFPARANPKPGVPSFVVVGWKRPPSIPAHSISTAMCGFITAVKPSCPVTT